MDLYKSTAATSGLKHGKLMVGLAAVPITLVAPGVTLDKLNAQRGVMIRNMSDKNVYVGGEGVSVHTGFPLSPLSVIVIPVDSPEGVYAVAADADCECRWILV